MLTLFIYAFRTGFVVILAVTSVIGMRNESECSYSSAKQ